jgi:glyoxylase-like metal-dependent hydrolase (beta-lactamase superfamily II)
MHSGQSLAARSAGAMAYKTLLALATAAIALMGPAAYAQERPGPLTLTPHVITKSVYWVEGGSSNAGFVVGDKGVVAIDAQKNADTALIELGEIAKLTPKPVDAVIITHGDPDHVGGIAGLPAGTAIIEQENTRAAIIASANDGGGGPVYGAMYRDLVDHHMPTHSVGASEDTAIDGVKMRILFVAPGHSSGDLIVYLPAQKVVFAGDVVTTNTGRYPIIHIGGSSLGWIAAMKTILALDANVIVPGHGAIETKAQLRVRLKDVEDRREAIKAMVNQGKTLEEINAALPEKPLNPMFPSFNQTTYIELTKGYPPAVAPWMNIVRRPQ